jgi:hypothetical protein
MRSHGQQVSSFVSIPRYFHRLFRQTAELAPMRRTPQDERRVICEQIGNK